MVIEASSADVATLQATIDRYRIAYEQNKDVRVFAPLAEAYRKMGDLDKAIALCRDGLLKYPNSPGGFVTLGRAYLGKGDAAKAREALERATGLAPENIAAYRALAEACAALRDVTQERDALTTLLLLSPDDADAHARLLDLEARTLVHSHPAVDGDVHVAMRADEPEITSDESSDLDAAFNDAMSALGGTLGGSVSEVGSSADAAVEDATSSDLEQIVGDLEGRFGDEPVSELFDPESFFAPPAAVPAAPKVDPLGATSGPAPSRLERANATAPVFETETLADLYYRQGQVDQAKEIFARLVARDPANADLVRKLVMCGGEAPVAIREAAPQPVTHGVREKLEQLIHQIHERRRVG